MTRILHRTGLRDQVKDLDHIFGRSFAWRNVKAGVPLVSVWVLEQYIRAMQSEVAITADWK